MATKKWDARFSHPVPHDNAYYAKCMLGGVLSCGITHTVITPLDVVKCNMQVDPGRFKSLPQGLGLIAKTEGMCLWGLQMLLVGGNFLEWLSVAGCFVYAGLAVDGWRTVPSCARFCYWILCSDAFS